MMLDALERLHAKRQKSKEDVNIHRQLRVFIDANGGRSWRYVDFTNPHTITPIVSERIPDDIARYAPYYYVVVRCVTEQNVSGFVGAGANISLNEPYLLGGMSPHPYFIGINDSITFEGIGVYGIGVHTNGIAAAITDLRLDISLDTKRPSVMYRE